MDEFKVTLKGESYAISRELVITAMRDREPANIQTHAVDIEGRAFPVKQVLAETLGVARSAFISTRAQSILTKLGFRVWDVTRGTAASRSLDHEERDARESALALAIEYLGTGAESDVGTVLRVATEFDRWLGETAAS